MHKFKTPDEQPAGPSPLPELSLQARSTSNGEFELQLGAHGRFAVITVGVVLVVLVLGALLLGHTNVNPVPGKMPPSSRLGQLFDWPRERASTSVRSEHEVPEVPLEPNRTCSSDFKYL